MDYITTQLIQELQIIAYRPSNILYAGQEVVLDTGRVVQVVTVSDLQGLDRKLWEMFIRDGATAQSP